MCTDRHIFFCHLSHQKLLNNKREKKDHVITEQGSYYKKTKGGLKQFCFDSWINQRNKICSPNTHQSLLGPSTSPYTFDQSIPLPRGWRCVSQDILRAKHLHCLCSRFPDGVNLLFSSQWQTPDFQPAVPSYSC